MALGITALSVIFFCMADPVWGLLPKAQDDPQLITEAIAAAIAAHESDPDAHLGEGESLEMHRQNEVIDHPAGSIVGDKISFNEYVLSTPFFTPDMLTGARFDVSFPALTVQPEWDPSVLPGIAYFNLPLLGESMRNSDIVLRSLINGEIYGEDSFLQFGIMNYTSTSGTTKVVDGAYFSYEDGHLYARVKWSDPGHEYDFSDDLGEYAGEFGPDMLQITYLALDQVVRFWINGEEVSSYDLTGKTTGPFVARAEWRGYQPDEESFAFISASTVYYTVGVPE